LDGSTGETEFFTFPVDQFHAEKDNFDIQIGNNRFLLDKILLDIKTPNKTIKGELDFKGVIGWPVSIKSPGIMGWYAWVPRMECYHAVLGFDHIITGNLQIDHHVLDFTNGRGYIEKDWGKSFPKGYVWMQSNHFQDPGISYDPMDWL